MILAEAIYIGNSIEINNNQIIFNDPNITQLQLVKAVKLLAERFKQLSDDYDKCIQIYNTTNHCHLELPDLPELLFLLNSSSIEIK